MTFVFKHPKFYKKNKPTKTKVNKNSNNLNNINAVAEPPPLKTNSLRNSKKES